MKSVLAITMGDPAGIGPEIVVKALADQSLYEDCIPIVIGDAFVIQDAIRFCGSSLSLRQIDKPENAHGSYGTVEFIDVHALSPETYHLGEVSAACGHAAFQYVITGIQYAMRKQIQGVVTGPLNKEALHLAGHMYSGHTEIFADYTNTKDYAMLLIGGGLRVIHCTTHVSMRKACNMITQDRVYHVIKLAHQAMQMMGLANGTIGVAGLNAHCSENGLFGNEEAREIRPAVDQAAAEGIRVEGPIPPDTIFVKALGGQYSIVVAMYHDQGHIPLKLMGFHMDPETGIFSSVSGINTTIGLPIIRTSVDHGTAFDKAGRNEANPQSLKEAILLAAQMAQYDGR